MISAGVRSAERPWVVHAAARPAANVDRQGLAGGTRRRPCVPGFGWRGGTGPGSSRLLMDVNSEAVVDRGVGSSAGLVGPTRLERPSGVVLSRQLLAATATDARTAIPTGRDPTQLNNAPGPRGLDSDDETTRRCVSACNAERASWRFLCQASTAKVVSDATRDHPQPLNPDEEAFIRSLGRVTYTLPRAMDAVMVREQRLPLVEYMTLVHLSEAPERQLRMSELAATIEMSLSGMTRVVARLEGEGLVQRVRCEQDGRGWNAVLTDTGLARLHQAWPSHLAAVRRLILTHFDGIDLGPLTQVLQRIAT